MAGAGFKTFNTGDVLTASDVNTYLMQQTVMVFADASARSTALGANVAEGMISYLKDTNATEVYDGSSWVSIGNSGDITGVTAGTGLTGGGASGAVTLDFDVANYGGGQWAAGKNKIINGDFFINQRGFTSTTSSGEYGLDRWVTNVADGTSTYSVQQFTLGTAPVSGYEAKQYARMVTTGQTLSNAKSSILQRIESVRTFAGQSITVSFWAKAATGTPYIACAVTQSFGTGGSPSSNVTTATTKQTLSTSWARYSFNFTVPSISGKTIGTNNNDWFGIEIWFSGGSDRNAITDSMGIQSNTFDIWGVQVEAGSTATPFQTATGTIQGELAAAQRYYWRWNATATYSPSPFMGYSTSTSQIQAAIYPPVTMRTNPSTTVDYSSGLRFTEYKSTFNDITSLAVLASTEAGTAGGWLISANASSGTPFTAGRVGSITASNNASAYIGFTAEL